MIAFVYFCLAFTGGMGYVMTLALRVVQATSMLVASGYFRFFSYPCNMLRCTAHRVLETT